MSRRRKLKPRLSPIWMPWLRDKLADWLDTRGDMEYARPRSDYADMLQLAWSQADSLRASPMWFVSRDMTALAVHTALYEEPPEVEAPSSTGFVMFDGGLDLECVPDAPAVHVVAVRWIIQFDGRDRHVGVSLFTDDRGVREALRCLLPLVPVPRTALGEVEPGATAVIGDILYAVWALSAEPTVCEVDGPRRPPAGESLPQRVVERAISDVRMVVLRERRETRPAGNGGGHGGRRAYSHRFIVRGFWRNQAHGPGHSLRRRQWIPPYVKGPADKPLVAKETVRIWRR